jgi:hypothetical protein
LGGSHLDDGERLVTGWHFHDVHEIEYACRGGRGHDGGRSLPAAAPPGGMDPGGSASSDDVEL